jgi:hypothetical protein
VDPRITLFGNVFPNEFGMTFDGDGDWVEVPSETDYAGDASFTINLWVTQSLCKIPGWFETLYAHSQYRGDAASWQNNSYVSLQATCWGRAPSIQMQFRTSARDSAMGELHIPVADAPTGSATTATWMMVTMTVSPTVVQLFVDGVEFTEDYAFSRWDRYDEGNVAQPDPGQLSKVLTGFSLSEAAIVLGHSAGDGGDFEGSISHLSIYAEPLTMISIDCLYQAMESTAPTCSATGGRRNWGANYYATFLDGEYPEDTFPQGETHMNNLFGLVLDGDGDYLELKGDEVGFARDGSFGITFWVSKPACNLPGNWEFILSQLQDTEMSMMDEGNSGVDVYIGCDDGGRTISTVTGDILRTRLRDADGTMAAWDVKLDYFKSGATAGTWIHVVMNVHPAGQDDSRPSGGVEIWVDGRKLPANALGFPADRRSWRTNTTTADADSNVANPNPMNFSRPLVGFSASQMYLDNERYSVDMVTRTPPGGSRGDRGPQGGLAAGDHTLTVTSGSRRSGWHGGYWELQLATLRDFAGVLDNLDPAYMGGREDGHSAKYGDGTDGMGTPAGTDSCATFCSNNGFAYMGLQWENECFCDNTYGSFGQAPMADCDVDGDGSMDCGTISINRTAGEDGCSWRNAVYDITSADSPQPLGCFVDGGGHITIAGGEEEGQVSRTNTITFTLEEQVELQPGCECDMTRDERPGCGTDWVSRGRTRNLGSPLCIVINPETCTDAPGLRDAYGMDGAKTRPCSVEARLRIYTKDGADDVSWSIDDGSAYSGPETSSVFVGARADLDDDHFFLGTLAGLGLNTNAYSDHEAKCMYLQGEQSVGKCAEPSATAFSASLFEPHPAITTHGGMPSPTPFTLSSPPTSSLHQIHTKLMGNTQYP